MEEQKTEQTKELSELEKLKAKNDEFDKELIRGRQLREEAQKLEAERMLASTAGQPQQIQTKNPAKDLADEMVGAFR